MRSVELHIDAERTAFVLRGDTSSILENRRAFYFFKDVLSATIDERNEIVIPYAEEPNRDVILKKIHLGLEKYGIRQTDSGQVQEVASKYFLEQAKFAEFSEKARNIWHNEIEHEDFAAF